MFRNASMCGKRLNAWKTNPMARRCFCNAAGSKITSSSLIASEPSVGVSRPPTMRSNVDFPPPEGPMKARLRTSSKTAVTPSTARWPPKDLARPLKLSFKFVPLLQPLRPERDGERQKQVTEGEGDVAFQLAVGVLAHDLRVLGKLVEGDDREQGGVLDEVGELAGERRKNLADGLRENDEPVRLGAGEADGFRGFQLGFSDALQPAADDFADVRAAEAGKDEDAADVAVLDAKLVKDAVVQAEDLHEQRRAADGNGRIGARRNRVRRRPMNVLRKSAHTDSSTVTNHPSTNSRR